MKQEMVAQSFTSKSKWKHIWNLISHMIFFIRYYKNGYHYSFFSSSIDVKRHKKIYKSILKELK